MTTAQYQDHAAAFVCNYFGAESWSIPLHRRCFCDLALSDTQRHWRECIGEIAEIGHLIVELGNDYPPDDMDEDDYFSEICELYSLEEEGNK